MATVHTPQNVERVAKAFLKELKGWFKKDGVTASADHIANGNDYYDANMAMDAAFKACRIPVFKNGRMSEETSDLWNAAWDRAVEIERKK